MKITLLQRNIHWCDPERNRAEIEKQLKALPETDLCVLPEMFTTGFCMEPSKVAEPENDSPTLDWMFNISNETGIALMGSIAIKKGEDYYNRLYIVTPYREFDYYDKVHLFTYGGERNCYKSGGDRLVIEYRRFRFLFQICYDLRFPVASRYRKPNDYQGIIYVANWPTSRRDVWDTLLKARALENQCYVIGVNRVGEDPNCSYNGGSQIFDAYGHRVAACKDGVEEAVTFELDLDKLAAFREKFPVLEDRDWRDE